MAPVTVGPFAFLSDVDDKPSETAGLVRLSSGAVFRVKPLPRAIVRRVLESVPAPSAPIATLSDGRQEENLLDPEFEKAQNEADMLRLKRLSRLFKVRGVELVDPGQLPLPDSDGWIAEMAVVGIVVDVSSPEARYSEWLDLVAILTDEDNLSLFAAAQSAIGLLEWEVQTALRFFPDLAGFGTST